jgi:thiosulfate dehydrogenase [quinone] large subunit
MTETDAPAGPNDHALAALRIAVGVFFVVFGEYKVAGPGFIPGGFEGWIHRFLSEGSAYPWIVPVLQHLVLPHARAFAILVAAGESAIGLSLVLGLWSRLASNFGVVYMLALLFSSNYPGAHAPLWEYFGASLDHSVLACCFAALAAGHPEQVWAISRFFDRPGH